MSEEKAAEEVVKEEKVAKIEKNGITRPKVGTKTGRVFDISDELSNAAGAPAKRADVLAQCEDEGINKATAATQYGRWRKFHGLKKEVKEAAPVTEDAVAEDASAE